MTQIKFLEKFRECVFGQRVKGEPAYDKKPSFKTIYPENRPSEFEWYREFRVSSLHGVNQNLHLKH